MSERMGVEHHCNTPRSTRLRRRPWTCPYCRRTWQPEGPSAWFTDDEGGEVIGFTMRYPDGTAAQFGSRDGSDV